MVGRLPQYRQHHRTGIHLLGLPPGLNYRNAIGTNPMFLSLRINHDLAVMVASTVDTMDTSLKNVLSPRNLGYISGLLTQPYLRILTRQMMSCRKGRRLKCRALLVVTMMPRSQVMMNLLKWMSTTMNG
jgi:hypothetical protein